MKYEKFCLNSLKTLSSSFFNVPIFELSKYKRDEKQQIDKKKTNIREKVPLSMKTPFFNTRSEYPDEKREFKNFSEQRKVWETIADSWSMLRNKPEEIILKIADNTNIGPVLDVACGNGRNLLPFAEKNLVCVGLDFSKSMIREARKFLKRRGAKAMLVVGDASRLPFKDNSFHLVIFVRSLHNLITKADRLIALRECRRVGKRLVLSVWKKWQRRFILKLLMNFFSSDLLIDWNYHGKVYKRFYHLYTKKELERELRMAGYTSFKMFDDGKGNLWIIA